MPKKFSPELRDRAVRMVYDRQAREGGPAQHRSMPSRHSSASVRRPCGSGATVTAPPNRPARESHSMRRTAGCGENSPKHDALTRS